MTRLNQSGSTPHYTFTRGQIGGTWHYPQAGAIAYADYTNGNYSTVNNGFLVFQADSKNYRMGSGSTSRTNGFSFQWSWTVPAGVGEVTVLCIGAGGGAAATGSNRGGGGGAGGALQWATGTATPGDTWDIFAGSNGYTSGSSVTASGIAGGGSGVRASGSTSFCVWAQGGEGGPSGLSSGSVGTPADISDNRFANAQTGCLTPLSSNGGGDGGEGGDPTYTMLAGPVVVPVDTLGLEEMGLTATEMAGDPEVQAVADQVEQPPPALVVEAAASEDTAKDQVGLCRVLLVLVVTRDLVAKPGQTRIVAQMAVIMEEAVGPMMTITLPALTIMVMVDVDAS